MEGKDGKTERATQHRRDEERRKGNVFVSQEVTSLFVLLVGVVALRYAMPALFAHVQGLLTICSRFNVHTPWTAETVGRVAAEGCLALTVVMAPFFISITLGSIAGTMVQTGPYFSMEALKKGLAELSPAQGLRQLCSPQAFIQLLLSVLKMAAVVLTAYFVCRDQIPFLIGLQDVGLASSASWIFHLIYRLALTICVVAIVIAALDWILKKRQHEKSIMMSKQEVKEEFQQYEPSPLVRKALNRRMRQLTLSRMMAAVPNANVIITNPDHVAIAIEYDAKSMSAPKVTAKGLRLMAERIKTIARENNVPIVRRPETARALYKHVKVGQQVPSQFFRAVAEILAYLHKLGRKVGLRAA
ncbi:MAG: EscU/YscU/HrcU family type III secretion system export apparatus switch protein [bacterium]